MSMLIHKQYNIGSSYFFLIDEKLKSLSLSGRDCVLDVFEKSREKEKILRPINFIDIYKILVKGKLHSINLLDMSSIIKLLYEKKFKSLAEKLASYSDVSQNLHISDKEINQVKHGNKHIFNIISRFIFVVSDLHTLTNNIKNSGLTGVNTGSQSFRGTTSYLNYILTTLDKDFRDSMFRHNLLYKQKSNRIPRHKFHFNNIHNNLGNSR